MKIKGGKKLHFPLSLNVTVEEKKNQKKKHRPVSNLLNFKPRFTKSEPESAGTWTVKPSITIQIVGNADCRRDEMQIVVQILVMVRLWNRLYLYDLWHAYEFWVVKSFKKMLFFLRFSGFWVFDASLYLVFFMQISTFSIIYNLSFDWMLFSCCPLTWVFSPLLLKK